MYSMVSGKTRESAARAPGLALIAALLWGVLAPGAPAYETIDMRQVGIDAVRVFGPTPDGEFGSGSASNGQAFGDFNADGFDDLLVGEPFAQPGGLDSAGVLWILFGQSETPARLIDLASGLLTDRLRTSQVLGPAEFYRCGWSTASADFNGDGYDDVVLGLFPANAPGGIAAGAVVVIYGSTDLPDRLIDLAPSFPTVPADMTYIFGDNQEDVLGFSVRAADFNRDGYDDLLLGAPQQRREGEKAGAAYIVYGRPDVAGLAIDLNTDGAISGWNETRILGDEVASGGADGGRFGYSLATTDVNGDGYPDAVIGGRTADGPGSYEGRVTVVYGFPGLAGQVVDLDTGGVITPWLETRILAGALDEEHTALVGAGDVNGDGFGDAVLGAPLADPRGRSDAGRVYVVFGDWRLPGTTVDLVTETFPGNVPEPAFIDGAADGHWASTAMGADDHNGDGLTDVTIGAFGADPLGRSDAGSGWLVWGREDLPGARIDLADESTSQGMIVIGREPGDAFAGNPAGCGDFDADGRPDSALSALKGENPYLPGPNNTGYTAIVGGTLLAEGDEAHVRVHSPVGPTPLQPLGNRLASTMRAAVAFGGGDNGSATASIVDATLVRGPRAKDLLTSFTEDVAPILWQFTTDRVGYTTAVLHLEYVDADIANVLNRESLTLYQAPDLNGPWLPVGNQRIETTRSLIRATVDSFGYFAIGGLKYTTTADWELYE